MQVISVEELVKYQEERNVIVDSFEAVPMSVIEDIKAEILGLMSHDDYMIDGMNVIEIIDEHISKKEND